jgi:hypothetical protein
LELLVDPVGLAPHVSLPGASASYRSLLAALPPVLVLPAPSLYLALQQLSRRMLAESVPMVRAAAGTRVCGGAFSSRPATSTQQS